ncbi:hypothetical protein AGMMS50255_6910 [Spirochaetia bacterium]|nr:hypothetical protein AGMMS50255_6910 [Spirochaetia bacterium]
MNKDSTDQKMKVSPLAIEEGITEIRDKLNALADLLHGLDGVSMGKDTPHGLFLLVAGIAEEANGLYELAAMARGAQ